MPTESNDLSDARKARLFDTHQRGVHDALAGIHPEESIQRRRMFEAPIERDLYSKGFEAGRMMYWATKYPEEKHPQEVR